MAKGTFDNSCSLRVVNSQARVRGERVAHAFALLRPDVLEKSRRTLK